MIRRDYKAHSFSPLNQINAQNVHELRMVWSGAMQDGVMLGNQPAPIVHNGVLYVNNNGMVLQALDAKDRRSHLGKPLWDESCSAFHARHHRLWRQDFRSDDAGAPDGFRCAQREGRLGYDCRRSVAGRVFDNEWSAARQGKVDSGLGGCGTYRKEKCFISARFRRRGSSRRRASNARLR